MSITAAPGFVAAGVAAGIKEGGALDLAIVATDDGQPVSASAVFTRNKMTAAPVIVSRSHLRATAGRAAAVVINSGNANAGTGEPGIADAESMCSLVAAGLGQHPQHVLVCFTIIAVLVVDRLGRKPLLLVASACMGVSLVMLGGAFVLGKLQGPWVLLFVLAYVASFAVAMGPVVWVVLAEIFPTRIRGTAMSIATVCLWVACFLVSQLFPWMLEHFAGKSFFVYAAMCLVAIVFVATVVPETKGKSLEEIEKRWLGGQTI